MPTYVLNEERMFSDIADGIAIVINSETGIYYGMNAFGTAVFENILNGAATDAVLTAIMALPDAPQDMRERLNTFIAELQQFDIILEGPGDAAASLDATALGEDGFALVVKEYSDAQELLLADPIHEVKNETGWQPDKIALETDEAIVAAKLDKMQE